MPDSDPQRLIVSLETDKSKANESFNYLDRHQKQVVGLLKSYRDLEQEGRKLRDVGTTVAIAGAAILAPLISSANEYSKRYGQLEQQSRGFIAAQQRQADATANLGRVAAQALTPIMNAAADFTQRVAAFASAHPELVNAAVAVGGGLAGGGAALIAAGTAITTVARAAELLRTALGAGGLSGLAGGIGTAVVSIGALAAGAKLGELAVNAFGTATGNTALESFKLADALVTLRQATALAAQSTSRISGIEIGIGALLQRAFDKVGILFEALTDKIATDFRDMFDRLINSIGAAFPELGISAGKDTAPLKAGVKPGLIQTYNQAVGQSDLSLMGTAQLEQGFAEAVADPNFTLNDYNFWQRKIAYAQKIQAANQGAQSVGNALGGIDSGVTSAAGAFGQSGSFGGTIDGILGGIVGGVKNFLGPLLGGGKSGAITNGIGMSPEAVNAYIDYRKQQAAADLQYAEQSKQITTAYNAQEKKAQQDHADKLAQIDQETADRAEQIHEEQAKAAQQFALGEKQTDEQNALARKQRAQQLNAQLSDLASNRDVAGFVQAQRAGQLAEDQATAKETLDKQQRKEQFDQQQADFKQQLADNEAQGQKKRQQANKQFDDEERDRKDAYHQQLADLKTKHQQENTALLTHYAETLAGLQGNIAGLQTIQATYYSQAATDAQNFVNSQRSILQQLYSSSLGVANGTSGGAAAPPSYSHPVYTNPPPPSFTAPVANAPYIPTYHLNGAGFAAGLPRVPYEAYYHLHPDERVLNEREAQQYNAGGDGGVHLHGDINIGSGNAVTRDEVQDGFKQAFKMFSAELRIKR